jgi:hypothetical protein
MASFSHGVTTKLNTQAGSKTPPFPLSASPKPIAAASGFFVFADFYVFVGVKHRPRCSLQRSSAVDSLSSLE